MSPQSRPIARALALLSCLAMILSCSLPSRLLGRPSDDTGGASSGGGDSEEGPGPVEQVPPPEPLVVAHQGETFAIYSLDGALQETRPASGLSYARPNTAQVVGESIYYVDSSGSSLGGVVRRVTSDGVEPLDFTAGEDMASVTFAVSDDESRIAWTHSTYGAEGVTSQLWIANIDGSDVRLAAESEPSDDIGRVLLPGDGTLDARWGSGLRLAGSITAIMNPIYNPSLGVLQPDDVNGAKAIYGINSTNTTNAPLRNT